MSEELERQRAALERLKTINYRAYMRVSELRSLHFCIMRLPQKLAIRLQYDALLAEAREREYNL